MSTLLGLVPNKEQIFSNLIYVQYSMSRHEYINTNPQYVKNISFVHENVYPRRICLKMLLILISFLQNV